MDKDANIYIAGHRGLVGAALLRKLKALGYNRLITRSHAELDLLRQDQTEAFFEQYKPDYVFLAAARVGGILANNTYPADFVYQNLQIQNNIIHQSYRQGVKRLLFLGSSCIYPKHAPQPMQEAHLMTGPLEPTNSPYATAKIAGIEMCWSYNRQHDTCFFPVMPTNLFGPEDNYDLSASHVLPALMRKFHLARLAEKGAWTDIQADVDRFGAIPADIGASLMAIGEANGHSVSEACTCLPPTSGDAVPAVILWGTGAPRREFLFVDDLADACVFLMSKPFESICGALDTPDKPLFNIGTGEDITIRELATVIAGLIGYTGEVVWDAEKPDGTPRKLLNVSRMEQLGWKAQTPLKQGVQAAYASYKQSLED